MSLSADVQAAAGYVLARRTVKPIIGMILGSGLGALADAVESPEGIPYRDVPGMAPSTVEGHKGQLVLGTLEGKPVAVMQGRLHAYEGYTPQQITFPVRVLQGLGCRTLIVTNAAGGLNPAFRVGELMLISDHLNLPGMIGHNPLYGPNDPSVGPRFPDMSGAYDASLRRLAREVAGGLGFSLHEGVYVMLGGPSYESPAEVRFLRMIGADAVGMSTASEVVVARHGGMRVLGISMISNVIPMPGRWGTRRCWRPARRPRRGSSACSGASCGAWRPRPGRGTAQAAGTAGGPGEVDQPRGDVWGFTGREGAGPWSASFSRSCSCTSRTSCSSGR